MSGTTTIAYLSSFHDSASSRSSSSSSSLAPSGHRAAMFRWAETEIHSWEWRMNDECLSLSSETRVMTWKVTNMWHLFAALIEHGQFELGVSSVSDASYLLENRLYLSHFQVPQLHPDQVLDIPEVFKSILQIGEQISCLSISISQTISV